MLQHVKLIISNPSIHSLMANMHSWKVEAIRLKYFRLRVQNESLQHMESAPATVVLLPFHSLYERNKPPSEFGWKLI